MDDLGILLKCRLRSSRPGRAPEICISDRAFRRHWCCWFWNFELCGEREVMWLAVTLGIQCNLSCSGQSLPRAQAEKQKADLCGRRRQRWLDGWGGSPPDRACCQSQWEGVGTSRVGVSLMLLYKIGRILTHAPFISGLSRCPYFFLPWRTHWICKYKHKILTQANTDLTEKWRNGSGLSHPFLWAKGKKVAEIISSISSPIRRKIWMWMPSHTPRSIKKRDSSGLQLRLEVEAGGWGWRLPA